ncbi:MAG: sucrose phosphorylase [Clostridia bacterium]|jgi:sucrose phosphorylase|nr:sucrose phosphorylase [Clostridia bacterium]
MNIQNKIMLITYADSIGKDLKDLKYVLDNYLNKVVGGVHILPFFPSSADRGFAPMTYQEVDRPFGKWEDIESISKEYYTMFDFMINHISRSSHFFKDFIEKKDTSEYKDLFIKYSDFWTNGYPSQEQVDKIYKRKPRAPYIDIEFKDGSTEKIWCTFDEEQIDLDVRKQVTLEFIKENLKFLCEKGASIIRLDAFAYATKKEGTDCFFVEPDTWEILTYCSDIVKEYGVAILPEIHEHYTIQMKIADKDYYVYDFALPMLVLHALYSGTNKRLIKWLKICPRKQFTTLDTHDGIGVVDVKDLMTDEEMEQTRANLYAQGANIKKKYSSTAYNNLDIYQINCTYYSALGDNDAAYLLARAIQFFTPGIPQVYYVGLLAGRNDIELLEKTKNGRDINRHYYLLAEIEQEVKRSVVDKLFKLMTFRNTYEAFNGEIVVNDQADENILEINFENGEYKTTLLANLRDKVFTISYYDLENKAWKMLDL